MNIPFSYRVVTLLAVMVLVAGIDRYWRGAQSTRYLEYGYILLCGVIGGLIGAGNDFVTSRISPEYFIVGKGLENAGADAVRLGLKTGFSAGIIGGAVSLFAAGKRRPRFGRVCRMLVLPVGGAIAGGVIPPLICGGFDPMNWATSLANVMTPDQLAGFRRVWWIHTGLYAGLGLGLAAMIGVMRRDNNTDLKSEI